MPNHRAVPRLAFGLDIKPTQIVSATEQGIPRHGYFVDPASPFVIHNFILDPNDPTRFSLSVPRGFRYVTRNRVLEGLPALLNDSARALPARPRPDRPATRP